MSPAALALAFALVATADPPRPLTKAEWTALEDEGRQLIAAGMKADEEYDLTATKAAFERAVRICRRLYRSEPNANSHNALTGTLKLLSEVLLKRGELADAEGLAREQLSLHEKQFGLKDSVALSSKWEHLAMVLIEQGRAVEAEPLLRDSLAMLKRLYPDRDYELVARGLRMMALVLDDRGKQAEAERVYRDALAMWLRLYPKTDLPDIANLQEALAALLLQRGKLGDAEAFGRDALAMRKRLFPKRDHPDVAASLFQLATVAKEQGQLDDAERGYADALKMFRRVFEDRDYGSVAGTQAALAGVLLSRGKLPEAERGYRDALAMCRRLYPDQPHPQTATCLFNLAVALQFRGELAAAEVEVTGAVSMRRKLHPDSDHPGLVAALAFAGDVLRQRGKPADAARLYAEALAMNRRLTLAFAAGSSEGDALTAASATPECRDSYLSNALALRSPPADVYAEVFPDRGALSRAYDQKQLQARAAASDPVAAKLLAELADARGRRAELIHAPATEDKATLERREESMRGLEKVITTKSGALGERFAPVARIEKLAKVTPADLQKALPDTAAVVDFLRWSHFEFDPKTPGRDGEKRTAKYLAFVVTRAGVKWLDLGPADRIEKAVEQWRKAITDPNTPVPTDLGAAVRELVWAPVRRELPKGVAEVYVSPDAALCRVPWVALPGDKPGTVLLEDEFAVATVPHAPFLLDHLWGKDESVKEKKGLLVVGGVDFDAKPAGDVGPKVQPSDLLLDPKAPKWGALAGTKAEADALSKFAVEQKWEVSTLSTIDATPAAVLKALAQAKHAHLATHGFFADKKFRSAFQLDEKDYQISFAGERVGRAVNSPLVMTGLVLAGANHPDTPGRGVVTGEALVDLDLSGLELAVLSACETGLGDVAGGEGTFGLQRAFHTAGTRNVVATLWSVSDLATAALMGEFYRQLWEKKVSPMHALKQAQLKVYHTDRAKFADLYPRGLEASGVKDTEQRFPPAKGDPATVHNHPALWAAFTLSGPGK